MSTAGSGVKQRAAPQIQTDERALRVPQARSGLPTPAESASGPAGSQVGQAGAAHSPVRHTAVCVLPGGTQGLGDVESSPTTSETLRPFKVLLCPPSLPFFSLFFFYPLSSLLFSLLFPPSPCLPFLLPFRKMILFVRVGVIIC